jgi:hypothetical protein
MGEKSVNFTKIGIINNLTEGTLLVGTLLLNCITLMYPGLGSNLDYYNKNRCQSLNCELKSFVRQDELDFLDLLLLCQLPDGADRKQSAFG